MADQFAVTGGSGKSGKRYIDINWKLLDIQIRQESIHSLRRLLNQSGIELCARKGMLLLLLGQGNR